MSSLYSRLTNCLPVDVQRSRLVSIRLDDCRILDAFAAVALQYVGIRSDSLARLVCRGRSISTTHWTCVVVRSTAEALKLAQSKRWQILPNPGFAEQLEFFGQAQWALEHLSPEQQQYLASLGPAAEFVESRKR